MNKKILFFVVSLAMQSYNARYAGMRMVKDTNPKQITLINTTNQTIFVRLKPTHVHPTCASCNNITHQEEVDDCCKSIKIIEYTVPADTTQTINLSTINVGLPDDQENKEYLDFTRIIYAKIYDYSHKNYTYITIQNNRCYTIFSAEKSIAVNAQ